ncbi:IclR family transcriptional regulator [Kyrpidia sp.]|uniref:IclR family transcriptional regulator n=1 Tax=Kyrpidia sp. TaxID=2073077 RepID=UPI002590E56E|nr:IclR family transcriptional regulator [Kyrpidia sp.]MCL6575446.1 IclR family transcriptional regulator [Kyrpidia sp.]
MLSSVRNMARVLRSFRLDCPELSLSELSKRLEIPRSTMAKLLTTMTAEGMLVRNPANGKYSPGKKMLTLSRAILSHQALVKEAGPYLRSLAAGTGLTAHLAYYGSGEIVWTAKVAGWRKIDLYSRIGRRAPAYAPASGRAILAFIGDSEVERVLKLRWKRLTPHTNLSKENFIGELNKIRERGYAIQFEEVDIRVASIGVPILTPLGQPIGAVSLAFPATPVSVGGMEKLADLVKRAAKNIGMLSVS